MAVVSIAIASAGSVLRMWSTRTLGSNFAHVVRVRPEHVLVTSGPYRFVRHPAYAGSLLLYAAIGLLTESWLGMGMSFGAPLVGRLPRIYVEERVLASTFGKQYLDYQSATGCLLPARAELAAGRAASMAMHVVVRGVRRIITTGRTPHRG